MTALSSIQRLKFELLADGMKVSPAARDRLARTSRNGTLTLADYASTSGIPLLMPEDVWVNAPISDYNPNFVAAPAHVLDWGTAGFVLRTARGEECPVSPTPVPDFAQRPNSAGEPHSHYGLTHTDRVRVSPVGGCANRCKFCDSPRRLEYRLKPVHLLIETIRVALDDPVLPAKHIMISGGTPREQDYGYLRDVYFEILRSFPSVPIDIMMLPVGPVLDIERLAAAGLHGLSVNLELFDDDYRRRLIPEKDAIPKARWLSFIERAVAALGPNVRSILMVGLEPLERTVEGVRALAQRGCVPVLSPFRPDPATPLRDVKPPDADALAEAYQRAAEAAAQHGAKLGPRCIPCHHNTLTFPDGSAFYMHH